MTFFTKTRYRLVEKGVGEVPQEVIAKYRLFKGSRLTGLGFPGVLHDEEGRYICRRWIDTLSDPPKLIWEIYEAYKLGPEGKG